MLGEGLGGSGVHWNGHTFRFLPYDFEIKSQTVKKYGEAKIKGLQVQDWGITYDELEPYFFEFEKAAGIGGEEGELGPKRADPFPNPPMKETPITARFKKPRNHWG